MTSMPYFRLFPLDWLGAIRTLSPPESHVYLNLTLMMLEREEPVEVDMKRTPRALRMSAKGFRTAFEELVNQGLIWETEGGFMTDFVQKEVQFRDEKRKKSTDAVNARWAKKPKKSTGDGYGRNTDVSAEYYHTNAGNAGNAEPAHKAGAPSRTSSTLEIGDPPSLADGSRRSPFKVGDDVFWDWRRLTVESFHGERVQLRDCNTGDPAWAPVNECRLWDEADDIPF